LLARHPEIKVLALSTYLDRRIVQQMLGVGARGYIAKASAGAELKAGILSVVDGRSYLCAQAGALLVDSLRDRNQATPTPAQGSLSQREIQVTKMLAEGKSTPAIAAELHISPSTVDVHRRNLMRKLDLHNVVEITKYAIRVGLIQP
jgi:two-component system NarL family response regulator